MHVLKSVRQSLYVALATLIVLVVLVVLGFHASWLYQSHHARITQGIAQEARANVASLSRNLAPFIEAFAVNEYEKMVANEIELRPHYAIVVQDFNMGRLLGRTSYVSGKIRDGQGVVDVDFQDDGQLARLDASFHVDQAVILSADGLEIGRVAVHTDDLAMKQELRHLLLVDLVASLVVALLLISLILFAIRRVVVRPLQGVADVLGAVDADGIPHGQLPTLAFREIRVLTDAMNDMLDEIRAARDKLRQSAGVFEHANEGIMVTDVEGVILDVNAAFTRITGYTREEVIGDTPRILNSGRHGAEFYDAMWQSLRQYGAWTNEVWNKRKSGEIFPQLQTISSVRNDQGETIRYISLFSDISELKRQQYQLEHLAHFDSLTNLPNRTLLADRLQQAMTNAVRKQTLVGVVFLDLDNFKAINDSHGHALGDRFLVLISQRLRQALRACDTLARLGGDEFVAIFQDFNRFEDCQPFVQRLLTAASEPVLIDRVEFRVSASLGIAFFPQSEKIDPDQLLRQADQAMYQAKQAGKNRYHVFNAELDRAVRGHHESLERIRDALAHGELELFYQPKVNMRTGQVLGAEALLRWRHPEQGLLSPAAFLPAVSGHVLSVDIGKWVIETALLQMERWAMLGLRLPVSVNIEAIHLQQSDFVDYLKMALARHPAIEPRDLEMEVLETAALDDIAQISDLMLTCQHLGVSFAIDDFGTGYSSLTYLKRLPVQVLKIDQSFVRDMLDDPDDLGILVAVLGLATTFGRRAIAEGVETFQHVEMLLRIGCELGQGYAIARPMPAGEIPDWVSRWRPEPQWRECGQLAHDDQSLLFAIIEYRAWVNSLRQTLLDEGPTGRPMERDLRLVEWIGWRKGDDARIRRAFELHGRIRAQVLELLALRKPEDADDVLERFQRIECLRDALQATLLDFIQNKDHA